jgi:hypothetical protein
VRTGFAFGGVRAVPIAAENRAPALSTPAALRVAIGDAVNIPISASDPDGDPIAYFAELDATASVPPDADLAATDSSPPAMRFSWAYPGLSDVGEHVLRVGVFDGRGSAQVNEIGISICRSIYQPHDVDGVIAALFGSQPVECGPGDINHDGAVSAADLIALRTGG